MPSDQDQRAFQVHELWVDDLDAAQEMAAMVHGDEQGPLLPSDRDRLLVSAATLPAFTDDGLEYYGDIIGYVSDQVQVLVRERAADKH